MYKLCHKLFQDALSRENEQHPRPAQNLQTDHHIRPAQRRQLPVLEYLYLHWSRYISLKGFLRVLHCGRYSDVIC